MGPHQPTGVVVMVLLMKDRPIMCVLLQWEGTKNIYDTNKWARYVLFYQWCIHFVKVKSTTNANLVMDGADPRGVTTSLFHVGLCGFVVLCLKIDTPLLLDYCSLGDI